jgi:hypothetical protein
VAFEPQHRFSIQVVGRFVEQQQFRLFQQQTAQRYAPALTARKFGNVRIVRRATQRIHRLIDFGVEIPKTLGLDLVLQLGHLVGGLIGIIGRKLVVTIEDRLLLGDALHHVFTNRFGLIELRFLLQVTDPGTLGDPSLAIIVGVDSGHDPQQGRLAGAVDPKHADLGIRVK